MVGEYNVRLHLLDDALQKRIHRHERYRVELHVREIAEMQNASTQALERTVCAFLLCGDEVGLIRILRRGSFGDDSNVYVCAESAQTCHGGARAKHLVVGMCSNDQNAQHRYAR